MKNKCSGENFVKIKLTNIHVYIFSAYELQWSVNAMVKN